MRRFADGRLIVSIDQLSDWGASTIAATEAMRNKWKPPIEKLLDRIGRKVGLEDAPSDYDCMGMEAVLWHAREMAREAFSAELQRRGIPSEEAQQTARRLTFEKIKS